MPSTLNGTSLAKRSSKPGRTSGSSRKPPRDQYIDGRREPSWLDEHVHVGERTDRGVAVDRVGQCHTFQDHRPDAVIGQPAGHVEGDTFESQDLLHLLAMERPHRRQLHVRH